jgi:hypothetical protein
MAERFIDVEITSDPQALADDAVALLMDRWPGWTPNDGDLEVVQIEALAPMAQNAAEVAGAVPSAIFRAYGTTLLNLPYQEGVAAAGLATFTLLDNLGHTIPAGTEIDVDGFAFQVVSDTIVPPGQTVAASVPILATETGVAFNGLTGVSVTPVTSLAFLESVVLVGTTANGIDAEDDAAYQDRLSRRLELQATTLVTTRDYEFLAIDEGAGRAVALHNGEKAVALYVTDAAGEPMGAAWKAAMALTYEDYRLVNTIVTISDATYTTIGGTVTVKAYPGFDPTDLAARISAALADYLNPADWGKPTNFGDPGVGSGWYNETVVRSNKLIDLIGNVEGVDYVSSGPTITGSAGSASGTNWTMPGTVALPRFGTWTVTVT